jgi:hypothetical protein
MLILSNRAKHREQTSQYSYDEKRFAPIPETGHYYHEKSYATILRDQKISLPTFTRCNHGKMKMALTGNHPTPNCSSLSKNV